MLLDGVHRAARCLREKRAFHVWTLSYQESLSCIVRQEINSSNPHVIVQKLRRVLESDPEAKAIEAEIECRPEVLEQVRALLKPAESSFGLPKDGLERIFPGFFVDENGDLYFWMREFLLHHHLPSDPRVKAAIWEEIETEFQGTLVREIAD